MTTAGEVLRLADLGDEDRAARFARLQERMVPVYEAWRRDVEGESIVVVPSVVPGPSSTGTVLQAYEERFLFLLLLLRQPRLRVIYVTGRPVPPQIVDYYLGLLPGVIPSQARRRLHMVAAHDGSCAPLTAKLLERPRLLAELRALIPDPAYCHLIPYATTPLDRDLALSLGVPLYGADPRLLYLGTKTGCRRLFAEAGVAHPQGREDVHDVEDLVEALAGMRAVRADMASAIVKLNEGASGSGNAVVDLRDLPAPGADGRARRAAAAGRGPGARAHGHAGRDLPRAARDRRRHRRGACGRRGGTQPERAAARDAARRRGAPLHPRPGPRRAERAELPRLPLPGRSGVRGRDHRRGGADRRAARAGGRARPLRRRLRRRARRRWRRLAPVRHRAQPPQGRHDTARSSPSSSSRTGATTRPPASSRRRMAGRSTWWPRTTSSRRCCAG